METRHPYVKCMVTWCDYWVKISEGNIGNYVGGCDTLNLMIATVSGDKVPSCSSYKIHRDPTKRGIHGPGEWYCEKCGGFVEKVGSIMESPVLPRSMIGMKVCGKCHQPVYRRERD